MRSSSPAIRASAGTSPSSCCPRTWYPTPRRLQRLRREARLLASLSHPNIAGLYAFEEENGTPFLVLELVEGETLAARLGRGRIPRRDALQIAVQIADALAAVHERGVVHRDLKPSNVMLTSQGSVKLLDFGVARRDSADASAETESHDFLTTSGHFIGTPAYMSPEQARGLSADQQSDIWAFGCVLYEMITGRHPFPAPARSDQIAAILEREPDWRALETEPSKLNDTIKRCLRKEPGRRLHHIADARLEVQEAMEEPEARGALPNRWNDGKLVAAGTAILAVLATALFLRPRSETPVTSEPLRRFTIDLGSNLAFGIDYPAGMAISPKGDLLAYVVESDAKKRIHLRSMDELQARVLDDTVGAQQPFFSADGRWLGFFADGKLKKVSVRGGAPIALAVAPNGMGGAWSAEGWIVFCPSDFSALRRVRDSGGESEVFSRLDPNTGEQAHWNPVMLADQRTVLFTVYAGGRNTDSRIALQEPGRNDHRIILEGGSHGRVVSPRWLVYARGTELLAVEFDPSRGLVTGTPYRVLQGVQDTPAYGAPIFAVSDQGTLVYAPAVTKGYAGRIVWLDRAGGVRQEIDSGHFYYRPRLSPDGTRMAYHFFDPDLNVWVKDLARGTHLKLTKDPGWDAFAVWSPDARQIAYASAREGSRTIFVRPSDGSGAVERILPPGNPRWPTSWSPDGEWLAFHEEDPKTAQDIWLVNMRTRQAEPILNTPAREAWARFSPDGEWLAYHSDESGANEVYARSVHPPSRTIQVSTGGGAVPIWSATGDEIYYSRGTQFMAVPVRLGRSPVIGRPQALFTIDLMEVNEKSAHGDLFLAVDAPRAVPMSRLAVVLGWSHVLAALADAR